MRCLNDGGDRLRGGWCRRLDRSRSRLWHGRGLRHRDIVRSWAGFRCKRDLLLYRSFLSFRLQGRDTGFKPLGERLQFGIVQRFACGGLICIGDRIALDLSLRTRRIGLGCKSWLRLRRRLRRHFDTRSLRLRRLRRHHRSALRCIELVIIGKTTMDRRVILREHRILWLTQ